jgi:hypothetical protein
MCEVFSNWPQVICLYSPGKVVYFGNRFKLFLIAQFEGIPQQVSDVSLVSAKAQKEVKHDYRKGRQSVI